MTAATKPVQIDAVAAMAPCRDEKKVPTRAGRAEPVKMPVIFCAGKGCQYPTTILLWKTHVDETQIDFDAVEHSSKGCHEDCKAGNAPMSCSEDLSIGSLGIDVFKDQYQRNCALVAIEWTENSQVL
jgi:hypothetical protein